MTDLTTYLNAMRERLAKATPCQCRPVTTELGSPTGIAWEICIEYCDLHAHARNDLARLLALAVVVAPIVKRAESMLSNGCQCDSEYGCICGYQASKDELAHYQAAVQEATQ